MPRHAAPLPSRRRTALVPAVLLLSVGAGLGSLALLPAKAAPIAVTAASASQSIVVPEPTTARAEEFDQPPVLDRPTPVPTRAPVRASRARRVEPAQLFFRPDVGPLTSGFKWRWGRMHTGIDLAGPYGSPIRAVTAGTVIEADQESGYGNVVKIRHADGVVTVYAHLSRILVEGGQVDPGQVIALEGNTGHSTGPHLHFEVRIDDVPINPIPWLASHGIHVD